jgi:hypothetical protein
VTEYTCGICEERRTTEDPRQHFTAYNEGSDTWEIVCEECQDLVSADA